MKPEVGPGFTGNVMYFLALQ